MGGLEVGCCFWLVSRGMQSAKNLKSLLIYNLVSDSDPCADDGWMGWHCCAKANQGSAASSMSPGLAAIKTPSLWAGGGHYWCICICFLREAGVAFFLLGRATFKVLGSRMKILHTA